MNSAAADIGYIVRVHGRVQGVGFRYSARAEAVRLRLRGWIRNEADGSVVTEFEGPESACAQFLSWLKRGPPGAHVSDLQSRKMPYQGFYKAYSIDF